MSPESLVMRLSCCTKAIDEFLMVGDVGGAFEKAVSANLLTARLLDELIFLKGEMDRKEMKDAEKKKVEVGN